MPQTHVNLVKFMPLPHGEAQRDGKASTGPSTNDDSVCKNECPQRSNDQPGCVNTSDCGVCLLNATDGHCSPTGTFPLPLCCTQSTCSGFWVGVSLLSFYQNGCGLPNPSFPGCVSCLFSPFLHVLATPANFQDQVVQHTVCHKLLFFDNSCGYYIFNILLIYMSVIILRCN